MSSLGFKAGAASKLSTLRQRVFSEAVKNRMIQLGLTVPQRQKTVTKKQQKKLEQRLQALRSDPSEEEMEEAFMEEMEAMMEEKK